MIIKGVNARYIMAEFRAFAGPSPNWEAVLVQIEHCAKTDWLLHISTRNTPKKTQNDFFIPKISGQR